MKVLFWLSNLNNLFLIKKKQGKENIKLKLEEFENGVGSYLFSSILKFVYMGQVTLNNENIFNMIKYSDYLCIDGKLLSLVLKLTFYIKSTQL